MSFPVKFFSFKTRSDKITAVVVYFLSSMVATCSALYVTYIANFGGYGNLEGKTGPIGSIDTALVKATRYPAVFLIVFGLLITMFSLAVIMSNVNYNAEKPRIIDSIPFDIFSLLILFLTAFDLYAIFLANTTVDPVKGDDTTLVNLVAYISITIAFAFMLIYFVSVVVRVKSGMLIKNTLVYSAASKIFKRKSDSQEKENKNLPLFSKFFTVSIAFVMLDIAAVILSFLNSRNKSVTFSRNALILSVVLIAIAFIIGSLFLFFTLNFNRLRQNGARIIQGDLDSNIDSQILFGDFKEINNDFIKMKDDLIKALEEKNKNEKFRVELVENISHDIKSPLTSIINYSDIICSGKCDEEHLQKYYEIIKKQSGKLTNLLQNLIDISLISSGTISNNPEKLNLNIFMAQVLDECEYKFSARHLYVSESIPYDDIYIFADGTNLWRIFDNLISNLCKYAMESTKIYLTVKKIPDGKVQIVIENVTDKVLNVSAQDLSERFFRGDVSRTTEGNGLGLSIIKELTQLQGGNCEYFVDEDTFKTVLTFNEYVENA